MKRLFAIMLVGAAFAGLYSCEDYLGKKTDLDFIDIPPNNVVRDIAYVPILPILDDFEEPVDIIAGFDELIYVVDAGREEVVALDESGRILGRRSIPGAKAIAQDRKFDLLVIGTKDTLLPLGTRDTLLTMSAIYRLRMLGSSGYNLSNADVVNTIMHPFYFTQSEPTLRTVDYVEFTDISVIGNNNNPDLNNQYYVSRRHVRRPFGDASLEQISSGPLGPNDAMLYFNNEDQFISPISVQTSSGFFNDYFQNPSSVSTLTQPPQLGARSGRDFFYASLDRNNALKVQYIEFIEGQFGAEYRPRILASGDTSEADGFINSPNKFASPQAVTIAGDGSQFIFVVDAEKDSLFQFSFNGFEGVLPPPASGINRYQKASFGGNGRGATQFNQPKGVAYFNEIVYVADAGNGRILRFRLTLDFE